MVCVVISDFPHVLQKLLKVQMANMNANFDFTYDRLKIKPKITFKIAYVCFSQIKSICGRNNYFNIINTLLLHDQVTVIRK